MRFCAQAVLPVLLIAGAVQAESPVRWLRDLKQGSQAARESGRPILIDFWADWCEPCKKMDAEVYADPAVASALQSKFIPVKINFDMQPELARVYHIQAIPHLVVTDSLGTELIHHRGILDTHEMSSLVAALPADVSALNRLDQAIRENRNDVESLTGMARQLRELSFYESSSGYYNRALPQVRRDSPLREPILRELGLDYFDLKDSSRAVPALERYLREIPPNSYTPECLLKLAESYLLTGQRKKAESAVKKLTADYPGIPETEKARAILAR